MRVSPFLLPLAAVALLAACNPPVPDSGARGPGFDTPEQYAARREAELRRGGASTRAAPAQTIQPPATPPAQTATAQPRPAASVPINPVELPAPLPSAATASFPQSEAQQLANQTRAALGRPPAPVAAAPQPAAPAPLPQAATAGAGNVAVDPNNPALSREQDFAAVSAERGIAADAERQRQLRQQYQLVTPTDLQRPSDNGPNIITYALNEAKPKGSAGSFRRSPLASKRRAQNNCRGYRTADVAQEEFLSAGGPARDSLNLDPDGDGNACSWDPATFRNLVRN